MIYFNDRNHTSVEKRLLKIITTLHNTKYYNKTIPVQNHKILKRSHLLKFCYFFFLSISSISNKLKKTKCLFHFHFSGFTQVDCDVLFTLSKAAKRTWYLNSVGPNQQRKPQTIKLRLSRTTSTILAVCWIKPKLVFYFFGGWGEKKPEQYAQ